jgi:hypothetical protein
MGAEEKKKKQRDLQAAASFYNGKLGSETCRRAITPVWVRQQGYDSCENPIWRFVLFLSTAWVGVHGVICLGGALLTLREDGKVQWVTLHLQVMRVRTEARKPRKTCRARVTLKMTLYSCLETARGFSSKLPQLGLPPQQ